LDPLITTLVVLPLLSFSAAAATVHAQPDGPINLIEGLFISTNQCVDLEFGALLATGETICMFGPSYPAGTYVMALNGFSNC